MTDDELTAIFNTIMGGDPVEGWAAVDHGDIHTLRSVSVSVDKMWARKPGGKWVEVP